MEVGEGLVGYIGVRGGGRIVVSILRFGNLGRVG